MIVMRFLRLTVVSVSLLLISATVLTARAGSGPPQTLSISATLTFDPSTPPPCLPQSPCHASGPFTASSPFCPSGTVDDVFTFTPFERRDVLTCDDGSGTIAIHVKGMSCAEGPTPGTLVCSSVWQLVSGTGEFKTLRGHGIHSQFFDPAADTLPVIFQGQVVLGR
jgi:hypothetical protein